MKGIAMIEGIIGLIGLVIVIVILSSLGTTVIDQTGTCTPSGATENKSCPLQNTSATGSTMYGLLELLYPIVGVVIVVTGGFILATRMNLL